MKFDLRLPSPVGGTNRTGIFALYDSLCSLIKNLKVILLNLDDSNITSLSASKLTGVINTSATPLSGGSVVCGPGYFKLANADGTQYVELSENNIYICVKSVFAETVNANSVIADAYGGLPDE